MDSGAADAERISSRHSEDEHITLYLSVNGRPERVQAKLYAPLELGSFGLHHRTIMVGNVSAAVLPSGQHSLPVDVLQDLMNEGKLGDGSSPDKPMPITGVSVEEYEYETQRAATSARLARSAATAACTGRQEAPTAECHNGQGSEGAGSSLHWLASILHHIAGTAPAMYNSGLDKKLA